MSLANLTWALILYLLPIGPEVPFKMTPRQQIPSWDILWKCSSPANHAFAWLWTLLVQILTCALNSQLNLEPVSSLWFCLVISGWCLTPVTHTGPDSYLCSGFLIWHHAHLLTTHLPDGLDSWLNLAAFLCLPWSSHQAQQDKAWSGEVSCHSCYCSRLPLPHLIGNCQHFLPPDSCWPIFSAYWGPTACQYNDLICQPLLLVLYYLQIFWGRTFCPIIHFIHDDVKQY